MNLASFCPDNTDGTCAEMSTNTFIKSATE